MIYCAVTVLISLAFFLLGKQIGGFVFRDPTFITLVKLLGIPFAATMFYAVQKLVLFARMRYKTVLLMDLLFTVSNIVGLSVLHAEGLLSSSVGFYMARSGAALIGLIPAVALLILPGSAGSAEHEERFDLREYLQHSKYSSIAMLSGYGQGQVDTLAVAHYLTPLSAASYGAAKVFFTGLTMVTSGLVMVALPGSSRIAANRNGTFSEYYRKTLLLAYAFLLPGAAILAIVAGPIIHLCFHGRYEDAVPIVRIFCLTALVMPISSITDAVANGAGWFRSACLAAIIGGGVGIALSLSLTRIYGIRGAAVAPVLALTSSACVILWRTWRRMGVRGALEQSGQPCVTSVVAND